MDQTKSKTKFTMDEIESMVERRNYSDQELENLSGDGRKYVLRGLPISEAPESFRHQLHSEIQSGDRYAALRLCPRVLVHPLIMEVFRNEVSQEVYSKQLELLKTTKPRLVTLQRVLEEGLMVSEFSAGDYLAYLVVCQQAVKSFKYFTVHELVTCISKINIEVDLRKLSHSPGRRYLATRELALRIKDAPYRFSEKWMAPLLVPFKRYSAVLEDAKLFWHRRRNTCLDKETYEEKLDHDWSLPYTDFLAEFGTDDSDVEYFPKMHDMRVGNQMHVKPALIEEEIWFKMLYHIAIQPAYLTLSSIRIKRKLSFAEAVRICVSPLAELGPVIHMGNKQVVIVDYTQKGVSEDKFAVSGYQEEDQVVLFFTTGKCVTLDYEHLGEIDTFTEVKKLAQLTFSDLYYHLVNWKKWKPLLEKHREERLTRVNSRRQIVKAKIKEDRMEVVALAENEKSKAGLSEVLQLVFHEEAFLTIHLCCNAISIVSDILEYMLSVFLSLTVFSLTGEKRAFPLEEVNGTGLCTYVSKLQDTLFESVRGVDPGSIVPLVLTSSGFSSVASDGFSSAVHTYFAIRKKDSGLLAWVSLSPGMPTIPSLSKLERLIGNYQESIPKRFYPHGLSWKEWTVFRLYAKSISTEWRYYLLWFVCYDGSRYYLTPFAFSRHALYYEQFGTCGVVKGPKNKSYLDTVNGKVLIPYHLLGTKDSS
jgi:hypothetical protein